MSYLKHGFSFVLKNWIKYTNHSNTRFVSLMRSLKNSLGNSHALTVTKSNRCANKYLTYKSFLNICTSITTYFDPKIIRNLGSESWCFYSKFLFYPSIYLGAKN